MDSSPIRGQKANLRGGLSLENDDQVVGSAYISVLFQMKRLTSVRKTKFQNFIHGVFFVK